MCCTQDSLRLGTEERTAYITKKRLLLSSVFTYTQILKQKSHFITFLPSSFGFFSDCKRKT